jgi:hypothetical protein
MALKEPYRVNSDGTLYIRESEKDTVILISKKQLLRPLKSKYLRLLEKDDNEEPGNFKSNFFLN